MTLAEKVVAIAAGEVGVKEVPAGSNRVKYNTWFYGREVAGKAYAWCCVFVCWCFARAGCQGLIKTTGGCTTLMRWAKAQGLLVPVREARAGDIALYQFDVDAYADHVGIVERVTKTGIVAIEGNTSVTSNDNGGSVMRRSRKWNCVMAVIRPDYASMEHNQKEEVEMTEKEVKELVAGEVQSAVAPLMEELAAIKTAVTPKRYHKVAELPWGRDTVERLRAAGIIQGDGKNEINLTDADLVTASMVDKLRLEFLDEHTV